MGCKSFKLNPLKEQGDFDQEFFRSMEYKEEAELLKKYLKTEGFDLKTDRFFIIFRDRKWECIPKKTSI